MEFKRLIMALVFAVVAATTALAYAQEPVVSEPRTSAIGNLRLQDRDPSFSSPMERKVANGDRLSPYPPYYHPTQD